MKELKNEDLKFHYFDEETLEIAILIYGSAHYFKLIDSGYFDPYTMDWIHCEYIVSFENKISDIWKKTIQDFVNELPLRKFENEIS